jgi:hypothetical protein
MPCSGFWFAHEPNSKRKLNRPLGLCSGLRTLSAEGSVWKEATAPAGLPARNACTKYVVRGCNPASSIQPVLSWSNVVVMRAERCVRRVALVPYRNSNSPGSDVRAHTRTVESVTWPSMGPCVMLRDAARADDPTHPTRPRAEKRSISFIATGSC